MGWGALVVLFFGYSLGRLISPRSGGVMYEFELGRGFVLEEEAVLMSPGLERELL